MPDDQTIDDSQGLTSQAFNDRFTFPTPDQPTAQVTLTPVDHDPFANSPAPIGFDYGDGPDILKPDKHTIDKLFGLNGVERYQFFPEKIVRSIGDAMTDPTLDPSQGLQQPSPTVIEGAVNAAGLAGGAPLGAKPGVATLGSGAMRQAAKETGEIAPVFYSAVENAVDNIAQPKMTGQQWLGTLANKPGVKPEELDWTGLKDYLAENKDKVITKQDIQQVVDSGKVQLQDVDKGINVKGPFRDPESPSYDPDKLERISDTKYQSYQLPGGENYREKLLTLPENKLNVLPENEKFGRGFQIYKQKLIDKYGDLEKASTDELQELVFLKDLQEKLHSDVDNYKSPHWDEPNVLAHVRMNDRIIDGQKSLHLEEIQSDWHQQGRDRGYKSEENLNPGNYGNFARSKGYTNEQVQSTFHDFKDPVYREWQDKQDAYEKNIGTVPDAPFKKTWHELALKRMIREAAEKGYDRLSWTPGEAQAARYDLSTSVDSVHYNSETQRLVAKKNNGNVIDENAVKPEKLADYVGKEIAKKIMEQEPNVNGLRSLKGEGLKVGGEGMKGFYDQIIPKAIEKIGKEHGVKVKTTEIKTRNNSIVSGDDVMRELGIPNSETGNYWRNLSQKERDDLIENYRNKSQPIHYIDIQQSLKDVAMKKGFPLFSGGLMFSPVDNDPWKDKSK